MKNIISARRYFCGQSGPGDCGLSCLSMILNYTGKGREAGKLRSRTSIPDKGFSLLDLRYMARSAGIKADCVRMDIEFLRAAQQPCILYISTETHEMHFWVCFGAVRKKGKYCYLIGDPARHVHYLPESDLLVQWHQGAALYFDGISRKPRTIRDPGWLSILRIKSLRKILLIVVPVLNLCAVTAGIGLSWLLETGLNGSMEFRRRDLLFCLFVLLLLVMVFKGLIMHIRQYILIKLNTAVSQQLFSDYIAGTVSGSFSSPQHRAKTVRKGIADISRIQNALSVFIAVLLSEGLLVLILIAGIWYQSPGAGLINTFYICLMCAITIRRIPDIAYETAHLSELSAAFENELAETSANPDLSLPTGKKRFGNAPEFRHLSYAGSLAFKISKFNLKTELLGTINVITVLGILLTRLKNGEIAYSSLVTAVIISYFITVLMPKICNASAVVTEGAGLMRHYRERE